MSERAVAQPQNTNTLQRKTSNALNFQRKAVNHDELTALPEWKLDTLSGDFAETRSGFDFSGVSAFTAMARPGRPLLQTNPMIQRSPKNESSGPVPYLSYSDAESTQTSVSDESTVETGVPAQEAAPTAGPTALITEQAGPGEMPASGLIVGDSATELGPGQMRRSEFLAQLRTEVCRALETAITGSGRTTEDCPYLDHWFRYYSRQDSAHIERAIRRYAPEALNATTARGYISAVTQRARQSAETWARTGEIAGVPEGIPIGLPGIGLLGGLVSGIGSIFFKAREGGVRATDDPQVIQAELGEGSPLDSAVRSRMQSTFGMDFAHVRTHTDSTAAGLSSRLNARAFTVGQNVAFGSGEYQPGTLLGDALIAHELAHSIQQRGATSTTQMQKGVTNNNALEEDADRAAVSVMISLWWGTKDTLKDIHQRAIPRLRSGLGLARCKESKTPNSAKIAAGVKCPNDPSAEQAKKNLQSTYGFAAVVDESSACWTTTELKKADRAFSMLSPEERKALKGVTLKRVTVPTCPGGDVKGCFKGIVDTEGKRDDVLEMADKAFEADKEIEDPTTARVVRYAAGKEIKTLPSEETFLHEVGHAVETAELRPAEAETQKADYGLKKAIDEFNNAPSIKFGSTSWTNNAEGQYVKAMMSVNDAINIASKPFDQLGNEPTSKKLAEGADTIQKQLRAVSKAIAKRKKVRKALPSNSALAMNQVEKAQDANYQAMQKVLVATETFRDAKKRQEAKSVKLAIAGKVVEIPRRLAELVAMVDLKRIDVKKSEILEDYPKKNWPHNPKELFADLFMMSKSRPESLKAFDPDIAKFYEKPIGPKGAWEKKVNRWIVGKEIVAVQARTP